MVGIRKAERRPYKKVGRKVAGIYIHIPFCKQACYYCDFHFSTSLKKKSELVHALCLELEMRKSEVTEVVETIYFGGGTPSLLTSDELTTILNGVYSNYRVKEHPEITLESNPDDLTLQKITELANTKVNRLSIGIQSFFEEDLKLMNRAHTAEESMVCIKNASAYFKNITIDLIYGMPNMSNERWLENVNKAISLGIPHISCYALTVEPKTALESFIRKGLVSPLDDEMAKSHYELLIAETEKMGFINYEFSNFGKEGFESVNNMAYWTGRPYLGVGPSAHSYDGLVRSWNINNNSKYIKSLKEGKLPIEREVLTVNDKYNEYIMTRLRTHWGISLTEIADLFGNTYHDYLMVQAENFIENGYLTLEKGRLKVTKEGKFLSDGIAADLFLVNLES